MTENDVVDGSPIRVVLVDDAPDMRLVVRMALERHRGFVVVGEASDGASAISLVAAEQPDIVLLDLAMPGMDGFDALPRLREAAPETKVVVLSGLPATGVERRVRSAGAVGFIEKGTPSRQIVDELLAVAAVVETVEAGAVAATVRLQKDTTAARSARRFVDETLRRWHCADALDTIELLVSELVTNAVVHADSVAEVSVQLSRDSIRIEVADDSTALPRRRNPEPTEPGGRGLGLVEALSTRWGVQPVDDGKVVWFEVPRLDADDSAVR